MQKRARGYTKCQYAVPYLVLKDQHVKDKAPGSRVGFRGPEVYGDFWCLPQVKSSMPFVAMRPVGRAIAAVMVNWFGMTNWSCGCGLAQGETRLKREKKKARRERSCLVVIEEVNGGARPCID